MNHAVRLISTYYMPASLHSRGRRGGGTYSAAADKTNRQRLHLVIIYLFGSSSTIVKIILDLLVTFFYCLPQVKSNIIGEQSPFNFLTSAEESGD